MLQAVGQGGISPRTADDATSTDTESDTSEHASYRSSASESSCSDEEATGTRRRVDESADGRHRGLYLCESGPDSEKTIDQNFDSDMEGHMQGPCCANAIDIECASEGGTDWTETDSTDDNFESSDCSTDNETDDSSKLDMRVEVAQAIVIWYEALRGMPPENLGEDTLKQVRALHRSMQRSSIFNMGAAGVREIHAVNLAV